MKPSLQALFLFCALGVGFLLGRGSTRNEPPPIPAPTEPQIATQVRPAPIRVVSRESRTPGPDLVSVEVGDPAGHTPSNPTRSMAGIEEVLLRGVAINNDDLERGRLLAQVMKQVTPDNAKAIARLFEDQVPNYRKNRAFSTFLRTWAECDGPAALAYANQRAEAGAPFNPLLRPVIQGWVKADPEACQAYLEAEDPDGIYTGTYAQGLLRRDPAMAIPYIEGMQDEYRKRSLISDITIALKANPAALLDWADQTLARGAVDQTYFGDMVMQLARNLDGPGLAGVIGRHADSELLTPLVFRQAAEVWAKTDAQGALSWVTSVAGHPRVNSGAFDVVLTEWAKSDPVAAIDWVQANEPAFKQVQTSQARDCLGVWAEADLEAATAWVEQNLDREPHTGNFTGKIVNEWVQLSPEDALDWVESLPEEHRRSTWFQAAYEIPLDQSGVLIDRIDAAGIDRRHDSARGKLADRLLKKDPLASLFLASGIADPEAKERVMVKAARELIQTDPDTVNAWLPDSELTERSKVEILVKDPKLVDYLLEEMKR